MLDHFIVIHSFFFSYPYINIIANVWDFVKIFKIDNFLLLKRVHIISLDKTQNICYTISMKNIRFTIKPKLKRNLEHLEVQKTTKMNVFRDRTKYTRKGKRNYQNEEV